MGHDTLNETILKGIMILEETVDIQTKIIQILRKTANPDKNEIDELIMLANKIIELNADLINFVALRKMN